MILFSDQHHQPKLTAEGRQARLTERLEAILWRLAIRQALDDQDVRDPAAIGAALGMPAGKAIKLLRRHQWREGDVAQLEAAAARLGLSVPEV